MGALFIGWIISDTVAGWNADKVGTSRVTMSGWFANAVEDCNVGDFVTKERGEVVGWTTSL